MARWARGGRAGPPVAPQWPLSFTHVPLSLVVYKGHTTLLSVCS